MSGKGAPQTVETVDASGLDVVVIAGTWHDVITDTAVDGSAPRVGDLLSRYPVALLVRPA